MPRKNNQPSQQPEETRDDGFLQSLEKADKLWRKRDQGAKGTSRRRPNSSKSISALTPSLQNVRGSASKYNTSASKSYSPEYIRSPNGDADGDIVLDGFLDDRNVPAALRATVVELCKWIADRAANGAPLPSLSAIDAATSSPPPLQTEEADQRRPALPDGLTWPDPAKDDYTRDTPEAKRGGGGIIAYLERVWLPILEAGRRDKRIYVDRRMIELNFPGVINGLKNYTRLNKETGEKKSVPKHLRFPTLKQVNDNIVAAHPDAARIAANRARNRTPIFGA